MNMNKNYLLLLAMEVLSVSLICAYMLSTQKPPSPVAPIDFSSSVKGCAENASGMEVRGWESERGPTVVVCGNQVMYSRAINRQCCRKAVVEHDVFAYTISIFETWSGEGCRCMCFSEIDVTVSDLPPGRYMVNIYERGTKPNGEPMEQTTVLSQEVKIR
jgi:hypothetical protein